MPMEDKSLRVIVRGPKNYGKTSTARLIQLGLTEHGYKKVTVKDLAPQPEGTKGDFYTERLPATRERGVVIEVEEESGEASGQDVVLKASRFCGSLEAKDVEKLGEVLKPAQIVMLMELCEFFTGKGD